MAEGVRPNLSSAQLMVWLAIARRVPGKLAIRAGSAFAKIDLIAYLVG